MLDRFFISFNDADFLMVTPIYPAGEQPIEGISAESLVKGIKEHGHKEVLLCPDLKKVSPMLEKLIEPEDLVLTLGAGNIYREGERFLKPQTSATHNP